MIDTDVVDRAAAIAGQLHESKIKHFTLGRILRGVAQQTGGGLRRDRLAEELKVSTATLARALALMTRADIGLVEEGHPEPHGGRPVAPLTLSRQLAMIGVAVIANAGERAALVGAVNYIDGTPVDGFETPSVVQTTPGAKDDIFVEELAEFADALKAKSGLNPDQLIGCGITVGVYVDDSGEPRRAFGGAWSDTPLRRSVEARLRMPVVVGNDITSLAVRKNLRPDQPADNYAMLVPIDFGVGGAVVVGNKSWTGAHGMAGEPGHLPAPGAAAITHLPEEDPEAVDPIEFDVPTCRCSDQADLVGHVEAFASPYALERRASENGALVAPGTLGQLATRSDRATSLLFYQGGVALGAAAVSIINWFDPEYVFIYLPYELDLPFKLEQPFNGTTADVVSPQYAADRYQQGLWDEIEKRAFIGDVVRDVVRIQRTATHDLYHELASSASYLVLRRLIRLIQGEVLLSPGGSSL